MSITTAKKTIRRRTTAIIFHESQALMETIHPITTAKAEEENNSNNIPESQALMETIHPITTVKSSRRKDNSNNKSSYELLDNKKGKLQAQETQMPCDPKAVGQIRRRRQPAIDSSLARRLATTTPKEMPLLKTRRRQLHSPYLYATTQGTPRLFG
jgi:hypothetical protein